jgi:hypothetical protein
MDGKQPASLILHVRIDADHVLDAGAVQDHDVRGAGDPGK